jgi:putative hydrolase of the HAD superfamily
VTGVLLDFFGTLVDYSPSRTEQAFDRSFQLLSERGLERSYESFVASWDRCFRDLEKEAEATGVEFSMADALDRYARIERLSIDRAFADGFIDGYLDEWGIGVRLIDGVPALLAGLVECGHELVLVSNTHHGPMVHRFLKAMQITEPFAGVITSDVFGLRKPRPEIYGAALGMIDCEPAGAVFVGDSEVPDYRGPRNVGIESYLIAQPDSMQSDIPEHHRFDSVHDIAGVVAP